jgi:phenylalanyl-tRNA synthetase alpha chain
MKNIYSLPNLKRSYYSVPLKEQEEILKKLATRTDVQAERLKRYLALPDLTRQKDSPVKLITERVINSVSLKNFDIIETPEVISPEIVFDLFNFPKDHPARTQSDTYYVDETHILRPHTSLMWKYYLELPDVKERLEKHGYVGALCYGTVYRRDEIDWQHSNVLHHIDGLYVCKKEIAELGQSDLEDILWEVAHGLFGQNIKAEFRVDHFPYTDPSLEMNIAWGDKWVEILGAGIVHPQVIKNLGLDPNVYNGWAFGFGADRLAMIKMQIPDIRLLRSDDERVKKQLKNVDHIYQPVSKYPPVIRDISFIVDKVSFNQFRYYELAREVIGGELIEEMKLLDEYEDDKKFGLGKASYTFRIVYRNLDRTLTNEEVDVLHKKLENKTISEFGAVIR